MHFVIYASSNHGKGLHNVTPIDLLAQSAVLSDGVVVPCLHGVNYMCKGGFTNHPTVPFCTTSTALRHIMMQTTLT